MKKTLKLWLSVLSATVFLCTVLCCAVSSGAKSVSDDPSDSYVKKTAPHEDATLSLWFEHSFKKVLTCDKTPSGMDTYSVYMAKNEIENAQFVLYSDTDMTGLTASVTDFVSKDSNAVIPSELYYEMYVSTEGIDPTAYYGYDENDPLIRAGETPDPVVPLARVKSFKLNGGKSQALFIKLKSSPDTPAGWYSAQLNIMNSNGDVIKTATVYAHVWDFELSEKTALQTAFYIANDVSYGGNYKTFYDYLLENRMCGMDLPGKLDETNEYLYNERVNAVRVSTNGCGSSIAPYYIENDYSGYADLYARLQASENWDDIKSKFYFYNVDEPKIDQMEDVITSANKVRQLWDDPAFVVPMHSNLPYPGSRYTTDTYSLTSIVESFPVYDRTDLIQAMTDTDSNTLWCPMTYAFTPKSLVDEKMPHHGIARYDAENRRGYTLLNRSNSGQYIYTGNGTNEVIQKYYDWDSQYGEIRDRMASSVALDRNGTHRQWAYCCMRQNSYNYCQQLIENTGLQTKLLFWQLYQEDVTGYLYYATNGWKVFDSRNDYFVDKTVTGDRSKNNWKTNKVYSGTGYIYGDGVMFYGPNQGRFSSSIGYVGSLRVELMRDGIEEYQMLHMLEEKKGKDAAKAVVSKVSANIASYLSMPDFSTEGWSAELDEYDIMASVRRSLGEAVEAATLEGQCIHSWDNGTVAVPAGCITAGEITYTCTQCSAKRTETIPTVHSQNTTFEAVSGSPATCTADSTQILRCTECGYEKRSTELAFHKDNNRLSYVIKNDTIHTSVCNVCGKTVDTLAHAMRTVYTNTCTEDGEKQSVCRDCGYKTVLGTVGAKGHSYENGVCKNCGEREKGTLYTLTVDGTVSQYSAGDTVQISVPSFFCGEVLPRRFTLWTGDTDVLNSTSAAETEFTMPEHDVTLQSNYISVGDIDGDGRINANDLLYLRKMLAGRNEQKDEADINNDGFFNAIDSLLLKQMIVGRFFPTE